MMIMTINYHCYHHYPGTIIMKKSKITFIMKVVIIKCNNVGKGEAILSGINLFDNDLYTSDDKSLLLNLIFSEFGIKISCNNNINSNNSSNNNNQQQQNDLIELSTTLYLTSLTP